MASFTDTIKLVFDTQTSGATGEINKLKTSVGQADGAFGKAKASAGGAFDFIKQNAGLAMAGAGAAVGAFALKAIGQFTDLALAAKSFSTAAGLSVEDASRWIETAGDLGVNTEAVQGAMGRLNREAASGDLAKLGITTQDVNERFLQTLEYLGSIPGAADRAKASFELLGKGGGAMAPLIANIDTLRERLADVTAGQLITDQEAANARQYADTMDELSDSVTSLTIQFGQALMPLIQKVADTLNTVNKATGGDAAGGGLLGWLGQAVSYTPGIDALVSIYGGLTGATEDTTEANKLLKDKADAAAASLKAEAEAAEAATAALVEQSRVTLAAMNSTLGYQDATDRTTDALADYTAKADLATAAAWGDAAANDDARRALNDAEQAALGSAAAHAKMAEDLALANGETWDAADSNRVMASELRTVAGTLAVGNPLRANLEGYADKLDSIQGEVNTQIKLDADAAQAQADELLRKLNLLVTNPWKFIVQAGSAPAVATGTGGTGGTPAIGVGAVAERGAAGALAASGDSLAALPVAAMASGGPTSITYVTNVKVIAAPLTAPAEIGKQVADYLDAFYRRNPTRLRSVS